MKKIFFLFFVSVGFFNLIQAQNAIVGPGFTNGWGSSCSDATYFTYFTASSGTTYTSGDLTPKATGNQYWRLAIGWSGSYYQISGGSDIAVTPGTKNSSTVSCTITGTWYRNVSATTNRYVFKTLNAGTAPTGTWVFFELGGVSATVSSVSLSPASPTVNTTGTVTATLSGALPTGQGVYLRYTTDNWATSSVSTMTGSGTTYTAYIGTQALNTVVMYYVFTSGSGLTIAPADADLYTINWNAGTLNGGSNYSYTVTAGATLSQSLLFDFGPGDGAQGDTISVADSNGKYWNNIFKTATTDPAKSLRNSSGTALTGYSLAITASGFITNGKNNGGLRTPYASQFTAGGSDTDLAIGTATEDFFYAGYGTSPSFRISGLNPAKKYIFKIFGSRAGAIARNAQYSIVGAATTVGNLDNSRITAYNTVYMLTTGYVQDTNNPYQLTSGGSYTLSTPYYGNNMYTYNTDYLYPNSSGQFTLTMTSTVSSQNCFINCMKLEEYKGAQTITFGSIPTKNVGSADFAPGATVNSGLTVSYTSSNTAVATIVSGQIHIVGVGTSTITASQAGDATYDAATNVQQTLTVTTLPTQTITFGALSAKNYGDANFSLTATASSGLTVTYASSSTSVATVAGNTVTIVGAGTTNITASQAGNGSYASALDVIQSLTVNKINQTTTFGALPTKTDADGLYKISASSSSGLTISYASSNTSVALISNDTINIVGAGTATITASQAGNSNYNAASNVQQTLTVTSNMALKQSLFIDFGPNETTNGDVTVNPDSNGNYWNNITPSAGGTAVTTGTSYSSLINSSNTATSYSLSFANGGFTPNGKLNGGLLSPQASEFGTNSELAILTATEDYIYTGALAGSGSVLTFTGLNPNKKYRFKIFGSRNTNSDRAAQYTLQGYGAPAVGTLQSSTATGLGGTVYIDAATSYPSNLNVSYTLTSQGSNTQAVTYYANNSTVYYSGLIQPDATGKINLTTISTTPSVPFAYINCMKIEEYQPTSTWTGTGSWSNSANWTNTLQSTSAVTVSSGTLTIDQDAIVEKITVNPGAKLTLSSGKTITAGTLNLNSDASGTATFVDNGGTTSVTAANIQQYLTTGRNWYISSPVSGASSTVFNAAAASNINKLYWYDETQGSSATLNWPQITNNSTSLAVTRGYVANVDASLLVTTNGVTFSGGSLNTGTITTGTNGLPALSYSSSQTKSGFNLVGNPYCSYLNWNTVTKTNLASNTMWYRTKVGGTYYFYTYNSVDGAAGVGIGVPFDATITNLIPPMQAFWVRAAGIGASLTFHNTDRAHKDITNNILRSRVQNTSTLQLARLQVSNGVNSDETVLYTYPSASNQYDSYDSPKMSNANASIPEIYTLANGENLVINGMNAIPYDTEIALGFTTGQIGTNFSIKATQLSNFDPGTQVILKDYQDINNPVISDLSDGSSYVFSSGITTNNTTRFALIFKAPSISTGINSESNDNVWISTNANNQIMINGNYGTSSVTVYNGVGQKLYEKQVNNSFMIIENHFIPGVYMISLTNVGKTIIKKVIID